MTYSIMRATDQTEVRITNKSHLSPCVLKSSIA